MSEPKSRRSPGRTANRLTLVCGANLGLAPATTMLAPLKGRIADAGTMALPAHLADSEFLHDGAPPDALVELGRVLFCDPVLSGNRNISCGTGDDVALSIGEGGAGFGPERPTRDGVTDRIPRYAQPLWNVGAKEYATMFHVTSHVEMAGQKGENPVATAMTEDRLQDAWDPFAGRLADIPGYVELLGAAFLDRAQAPVTFVNAAKALAAFQSVAFRPDDSPFDRLLAGERDALGSEAQRGMQLFHGEAGRAGCHSGSLLTDHDFHAIALPQIGPGKSHGEDTGHRRAAGFMDRREDGGRFRVTFDGADLPPLDHVIEGKGQGSSLIFRPLNPARESAFDLRDAWAQQSSPLRARVAAANDLAPQAHDEAGITALMAILESLTDPSAVDRSDLIHSKVPSGLPPQPKPSGALHHGH